MIRARQLGQGCRAGLLPGRFPQRRRQAGPGLGRKGPAQPRRHLRPSRGLDGDRAGAAEGVDQGPLGPPTLKRIKAAARVSFSGAMRVSGR